MFEIKINNASRVNNFPRKFKLKIHGSICNFEVPKFKYFNSTLE